MSNQSFSKSVLSQFDAFSGSSRIWEALAPLFKPGPFRRQPISVALSGLPATDVDMISLASVKGSATAVIPASACLERQIAIPRAVRKRAEQAVAMQLKTSLPMAGRGLVWRSDLLHEEGNFLRYRCLIVKEAHVKDLVSRAQLARVRLSRISIASFERKPLWDVMPALPQSAKNWAGATALAVTSFALIAIAGVEIQVRQLQDLVDVKSGHVAALRQRIEAAKSHTTENNNRTTAIDKLLATFSAGARPLQRLTDIASVLPSDVWLSELSFAQDEWRLSGFSKEAITSIVTALQGLPWAQTVRLDGPVALDSYSGQSRFDVVIKSLPAIDKK